MTARHAAPPDAAERFVLDQLQACHAEIRAFIAERSAYQPPADSSRITQDQAMALVKASGIFTRVTGIFHQLEFVAAACDAEYQERQARDAR